LLEKMGAPTFVGQVSNKNKFDAGFFGVNPKHCASTDPYVRILLEKVFEAIVDAGFNPSELRGTNTAVYTGSNISESENTYIYVPEKNNLAVMGNSRAMVSNRISYWLNVHGTSISIVSTETSGFEALSAACNEMKQGRCDAAVVGAVNLVMHPEVSYHYNELGVLSKDGKCRPFDAQERVLEVAVNSYTVLNKTVVKTQLVVLYGRPDFRNIDEAVQLLQYIASNNSQDPFCDVTKIGAMAGLCEGGNEPLGSLKATDGYARSDGVVVLFLQRARDAKRIYATVVHSEVDGCGDRDVRYTVPFGAPLKTLMERFYSECGIDPADINYLEAEGCGIKMADVEEMRAVDAVLLKRRRTPLLVGSVKSNMGHSNAAANLCSVAKVLIAMQTGMIPPTLHYHTPAVEITALTQGRAKVVTESTPWHGGLVALNSMGMTGTYAHTLLRSYSREKSESTSDSLPRLILLSSRTEQGVREILRKLESMPVDAEMARLLHDVYSTNIAKHLYRCYTVLPSAAKKPVHDLQHYDQSSRPVWFVFSGMGSQWPGMGRELMRLPVCATTIDKCHDILKHKGLDLKHIITTDDPHVFDSILHCFVGIAAVQLALVDLLNALGITADGFLGHSVGELGCAYADSCFTQEQMILAAYHRGRASFDATLIEGCMAAVGIGHTQLQEILPSDLDIACHNSSDNCTISGPAESVKRFVDHLQHNKIFARSINVANIAYHSRYIKPAAPLLLEALQKLIPEPKPRSSRWICTSVPEESWDSPLARYCSAEYHTNNLLNSVLFEEASRHIPKNAITIEVAPYGLLQAILHRSLGPDCTHIALTRRAHPQGLHFLLSAIGKMYLVGLLPQVRCLYPAVQLPVSRGTPSISPFVRWDHTDSWYTVGELDISELISGEQQVSVSLNQEEYRAYAGHVINGHILFPAFAFLKMVWDTVASLKKTVPSRLPVVFEDVYFLHQLYIEERGKDNV
ncbi:hypothetical protein ANN_24225, partial [Periplaneta americana]